MPKQTESTDSEQPKIVAPTLSASQMEQITLNTKQQLDAQPKFLVRIRKDPNGKGPNYETVQINGYTFTIMKGKDVEVPQTVRDILVEAGII
jgi:hypothetical protein